MIVIEVYAQGWKQAEIYSAMPMSGMTSGHKISGRRRFDSKIEAVQTICAPGMVIEVDGSFSYAEGKYFRVVDLSKEGHIVSSEGISQDPEAAKEMKKLGFDHDNYVGALVWAKKDETEKIEQLQALQEILFFDLHIL